MKFEKSLQEKYFSGIKFSDEREQQVFFSYIKGFFLLILDPDVKNVLEIGGGQSTALLSALGKRVDWNIITIDMNPDAIALKIRGQSLGDKTHGAVDFRKGVSINTQEIQLFYDREFSHIGQVSFQEAIKSAANFINLSMDARKASQVSKALGFREFSVENVVNSITDSNCLTPELLSVFRTPNDEFAFHVGKDKPKHGCIQEIMKQESIDVVFLDSGEFSSLPEWEVVERYLRPGGYVVLHDIFFPKSFKNWLVCGAILADKNYNILYVDQSTPQGLMVAQRKS